jgi:hypothetical protein
MVMGAWREPVNPIRGKQYKTYLFCVVLGGWGSRVHGAVFDQVGRDVKGFLAVLVLVLGECVKVFLNYAIIGDEMQCWLYGWFLGAMGCVNREPGLNGQGSRVHVSRCGIGRD